MGIPFIPGQGGPKDAKKQSEQAKATRGKMKREGRQAQMQRDAANRRNGKNGGKKGGK